MEAKSDLIFGELYWVLPPWDVDAPDGYYNMWQPARYMGLGEDQRQLWRYLGIDNDDEWFNGDCTPRFIGPYLPMHGSLVGDAWAKPFDFDVG